MFVAFQFNQRRFRHQMAHPLVLMWKQMLTPPPPTIFCLRIWQAIPGGKQYTYRTVNSSILKWPSLYYLSTNCKLTWGFSHCRLLTIFRNEISAIPAEGEKRWTRQFEVKAIYGTLPCYDVLSVLHVILSFRQICALTPNIVSPHRPLKGDRD